MILRYFVLLSLFFLLNACGLSSSKTPEEHFYRLSDVENIKPTTTIFKQLQLAPVKTNGIYHERAILYRHANKPLEIHRYHYHFWSQTPAKLVQNYMLQYFQQSKIAENITIKSSLLNKQNIVHIELIRFERIMEAKQAKVEVVLKVSFADFSKTYRVKLKANELFMHSTVVAFSRALSDIMAMLLADLKLAKTP